MADSLGGLTGNATGHSDNSDDLAADLDILNDESSNDGKENSDQDSGDESEGSGKQGKRKDSRRGEREDSDDEDESGEDSKRRRDRSRDEEEDGEGDEDLDEDEEDDEDEDKGKKKEEKEEDDELTSHRRPSIKAINQKYPKFLKEFPEVRHAIFRAQKYEETFPTVGDAKAAKATVEVFDNVVNVVDSGDPGKLFGMIARKDPKTAYSHIVNFLPTLYRQNKELFTEITQPVLKAALRTLRAEGKKSGNTDLQYSAEHAHKFFFDDEDFDKEVGTAGTKPKEDDPEKKKLLTERQQWLENQYNTACISIIKLADESIEDNIEQHLEKAGIKPSKFESRHMLRDVTEEVNKILQRDVRHNGLMKSLWARAEKTGYSAEAVARVRQAYLGKVEEILPDAVRKIRREVFADRRRVIRKSEREDNNDREDVGPESRRGERESRISSGRSSSARSGVSVKEVDWSKTSDLDFLNDKVVPKRN